MSYTAVNTAFYRHWCYNRKRALGGRPYAIKCYTQLQLNHCMSVLQSIFPDAKVFDPYPSNFPSYVRWFDSSYDGDIVTGDDPTSSHEVRDFGEVFYQDDYVPAPTSFPSNEQRVETGKITGRVIAL